MCVTHFIWADYSSTAQLSPPLLIGETCAFSRFPLKPDLDCNPLICQIVTQWRKSTPCLTHRPLLGKSLSSALSSMEYSWIDHIGDLLVIFSVFLPFVQFSSIFLRTPLSHPDSSAASLHLAYRPLLVLPSLSLCGVTKPLCLTLFINWRGWTL